jgi:hypothetical protein
VIIMGHAYRKGAVTVEVGDEIYRLPTKIYERRHRGRREERTAVIYMGECFSDTSLDRAAAKVIRFISGQGGNGNGNGRHP